MITVEVLPAIQGIGQIAVPVRDIERATAFYRDTLGLRLWLEIDKMAFFDCNGLRLMLAADEEDAPTERRASIIYYSVSDIDAVHAALVEKDVEFVSPLHKVADMGAYELWMSFFRDSERNVLALMCEKKKS